MRKGNAGTGGEGKVIAPAVVAEGGFTLAELLVFLVIMIIFLIGVGGMISSGAKSSAASYNLARIENSANEAIVAITRQLRVATAINPASSTQSITFTGYLDGGNETTVNLAVADGNITRNGVPWIEGVESMSLTYFDERGTQLVAGTPDWNTQVRRIELEFVFSRDSMGVILSRTFHGAVTLRNSLDQE